MRRTVLPLLALAFALHAGKARASDPAAAQALFDEAKRLVASGKLVEACPKFLASLKLDPKPGAAFNLAECYDKTGQTASAWARYLEAGALAQRAGQNDRARFANETAAALAPKLSHLTLQVPAPAAGLTLTRDGTPVDPASWGTSVPVDPGKHVVEARAPGKKPWSTTLQVAVGDTNTVVAVPALMDDDAPRSGGVVPSGPPAPPVAPDDGSAGSASPRQKIAGAVLMGAGGVGIVIGSVFAAVAHSKYESLHQQCPTQMGCSPTLASDLSSYHSASGTFVGSFVAGGALLATGIVVFVTAPRRAANQAFIEPRVGLGSIGFGGGF